VDRVIGDLLPSLNVLRHVRDKVMHA
jgi:hypothetical protein